MGGIDYRDRDRRKTQNEAYELVVFTCIAEVNQ